MVSFYKIVNKTLLDYCLTIPKDLHDKLDIDSLLLNENGLDVSIKWGEEEYLGRLCGKHDIKNKEGIICGYKAYQLHFKQDLLYRIKETFIQSYILIRSQIYEKDTNKQYCTNIPKECQEEIKVTILNPTCFEFDIESKCSTVYDNVFKNLLFEDIFGWMGKGVNEYNKMITISSNWMPITEIQKHSETPYVIYYLLDDINKQIYIGSAKRLGDRVKQGRPEIPGWNKFRFEKLHESYYKDLHNIEYHSIINFSKFFKNNGNKPSVNISDYVLVNKDYGYYKNK